jgi:acyl-coenzyme A thioesterase PaaI-like protein
MTERPIKLAEHGACFVCGTANPMSMGVQFYWDGESVHAGFTFDARHQGPPAHAHGGSLAAVLDEAMGAAVWLTGHSVVAAHLELDYRQPVPLHEAVTLKAWSGEKGNRSIKASAALYLADGRVAVEGKAVLVIAPHLFANDYYSVVTEDGSPPRPLFRLLPPSAES